MAALRSARWVELCVACRVVIRGLVGSVRCVSASPELVGYSLMQTTGCCRPWFWPRALARWGQPGTGWLFADADDRLLPTLVLPALARVGWASLERVELFRGLQITFVWMSFAFDCA